MTLSAILLWSTAGMAQNENPYAQADDTWISLDGTVDSVSEDSFVLNYGAGTISVEMDDDDRDSTEYRFDKGMKVRVTGVIDDDFFETTSIDASSVYIEELGTYFFADADTDDYDWSNWWYMDTNVVAPAAATIRGTVTSVDPDDDEFVISTGTNQLRVETEEMSYNPLDNDGYQRIGVGDRVSVSGEMDEDFFEIEGHVELVANSVVVLSD
ncbi:MAG: hypothetical protein CMJ46_09390 [Planctomyces sp.]|nr:hypothetical protein [Planctomyces sp.]